MILFYDLKYVFMLVKSGFKLLDIEIGKTHGFDPKNNYYHGELNYDRIEGFLLKKSFYVVKKKFKNIVLFLNYNDFFDNCIKHENYALEYYNQKQLEEYRSMYYNENGIKPEDFTPNTKVVLISNHGYKKDLNVLFIFDMPLSSGVEIKYRNHRMNYVFDQFQPTFVFYGLLLLKKLELLSIIYSYTVKHNWQIQGYNVQEYKHVFLLERNDYVNQILKDINPNDNVSSIIKQYFVIYNQIVNEIVSNNDFYTIEDKYELDNFPYSDKLASEKHLLQNYDDLSVSYAHVNPYSYLKYYMVILSSKAITNIITPKELSHKIGIVKSNRTQLRLNTINYYEDVMYFVDRNDSVVLVSGNKNYIKNINHSKKLNTKEFLANVLRKQTENLHLFFPDIEYEVKNFYKDSYNWKYIFYFKSEGKYDLQLEYMGTNQFHIIVLKEVKAKMFNHSFEVLFMRYVIRLDTSDRDRELLTDITVYSNNNQFIIFSRTHLEVLPYYFVNFFIDEEDIKQINDFTGQNMRKYYREYRKYDHTLPLYVYGGHFRLKVILLNHFFDFDVYKISFPIMEFYKDGLPYVAILISNYNDLQLTKNIVINNHQRLIKFVKFIDNPNSYTNIAKIILSMKNDEYISKGIYRFSFEGINGLFELFVSIAIPKHKFDRIMREIKNSPKITIEGVFLMNSIGNNLYLNGFLEKVRYK